MTACQTISKPARACTEQCTEQGTVEKMLSTPEVGTQDVVLCQSHNILNEDKARAKVEDLFPQTAPFVLFRVQPELVSEPT